MLVWNTVQIERIVGQLGPTGNIVLDEDLSRVSPLFRRHITPNGSYFHAPRIRAPRESPTTCMTAPKANPTNHL